MNKSLRHPYALVQTVADLLRQSAKLRSLTYLGLAAGSAEMVNQLIYDPSDPNSTIHYTLFPITVALTYAFASVSPEDRAAWHRLPAREEWTQLGRGIILGGGAILGFLGLAIAGGWASAPRWGWETIGLQPVLSAIALTSVNNAVTVWNEETVFHGYGFDSLKKGFGLYAAIVMSTALFAIYHGLGVRRLLALSLLGLVFLLLRLETGSLWLPIGFHWGWNMVQHVVLGDPDGTPSIRPLLVHGPEAWIGRPGALQPGWFVIIYLLLLVALLIWRRARRSTSQ